MVSKWNIVSYIYWIEIFLEILFLDKNIMTVLLEIFFSLLLMAMVIYKMETELIMYKVYLGLWLVDYVWVYFQIALYSMYIECVHMQIR